MSASISRGTSGSPPATPTRSASLSPSARRWNRRWRRFRQRPRRGCSDDTGSDNPRAGKWDGAMSDLFKKVREVGDRGLRLAFDIHTDNLVQIRTGKVTAYI